MRRSLTDIASSFFSDDGIRQVNIYGNGFLEFIENGVVTKGINLSYLTHQEQEDRAEEYVLSK